MVATISPLKLTPDINNISTGSLETSQGFGTLVRGGIEGILKQGAQYEKSLGEVSSGKGNPEQLIQTVASLQTELEAVQSTLGTGLSAFKEIFHTQI